MGRRHRARERALQILYASEFVGEIKGRALQELWEIIEPQRDAKLVEFTMTLVRGVWENIEYLDRRISQASLNWRLERMSLIDRNILRIAALELLYLEDIPPKVSIDEAIELAKTFGDKESRSFINGVLDRIMDDLQSQKEK